MDNAIIITVYSIKLLAINHIITYIKMRIYINILMEEFTMTIHTFEVSHTLCGDDFKLIQDTLKTKDPDKWKKESNGMSYWGLSKQGIIIKMFITKNKKKGYYAYHIIYRISARRVMDNHDFVGLFDTNDYDLLEKEVNFILHNKCKLLPLLEDCKMRRIDFCINAELANQEQVKAYIKTMKRANIPPHLMLYEVYNEKSKRTKPMKDDFTVYNDNYIAVSIYNKQRQMIKEQKGKNKAIFPASEIERTEKIVRIEIRCMEGKVSELKKKFKLKSIQDFMDSSQQIGDYLFRYYLSRICNDGKICTLSEALKRIDMGEYKPDNTELLKEFIEYANNTRSVAGAISTYKKWMDKKAVNRMIWMLSNIETNYVTATSKAAKLFDQGYIPTPLELYEDWC
ncbi:MAG: hypothetical protein E7406_00770 [Ruminococcaceae bacterium]|nr:hypothetical protein [Oscillospiraceae bacterium]